MAKMMTPAIQRQQKKMKGSAQVKTGPWRDAWKRLKRNKSAMISLAIILFFVVLAFFPQYIAPQGYDEQNYSLAFTAPCKEYPLGTDNFGRDILSRLIWGAQMSLTIGVVSIIFSVIAGGLIGAVSGFYGGKVDNLLMRFMDILLAIPSMLLAIAIAAALGGSLFNLMLAISISSVPGYARIVRGSVMSIKDQEFVEATKVIGASNARLIFRHMIPNALAPIIVQATLGIAGAIICACGLSYLGLGIQPPVAEWGTMLSSARQYIRSYPYMVIFPGLTIMISVGAFNLLGDGLRDALDPRMKQ
jgi:peptide/nickel transport system permease protein